MTAPDPRLNEIQSRLDAATPGPWVVEDDDGFGHKVYKPGGWGTMYICEGLQQGHDDGLNDAEFIASAPADVRYLLAELRKAHEALGRVEALAKQWTKRGEGDMADAKTFLDEEIGISLLMEGASMVENARLIRAAVAAAKARRTMSDMADVLAKHQDLAWNHEKGKAVCGGCDETLGPMTAYIEKQYTWLVTHQAAALSAAGFGLVADAKAEALEWVADDFSVNLTNMSGPRIRTWLVDHAAKIRAVS